MTAAVPILYVGGTGRTGSTVLDRMLGNVPGVFAAGELTWLWFALRSGGRCACGAPRGLPGVGPGVAGDVS